ncbi:DUF6364 family protein [Chloroflexota bacterium]
MTKKQIGLTIEKDLIKPAKLRSVEEEISISQICEDFLRLWLESDKTAAELLVKLKEMLDEST